MRNRTIAFLIGTSACVTSAQATDWLQFGYDQAHSGFNRAENGYSTQTGNTIAYHYSLATTVDSAPIYVADVATASGTKNLLFIDTKDGTLLVVDADSTTLSVSGRASRRQPTVPIPALALRAARRSWTRRISLFTRSDWMERSTDIKLVLALKS